METVFFVWEAAGDRTPRPRHPINKKHLPQGRTAAQRTTTGLWSDRTGTRQRERRGGAVPGNHAQPRPGSPAQGAPPSGAGVIDRRGLTYPEGPGMPYIWAENPGVYPRVRGGTFWGWTMVDSPGQGCWADKTNRNSLDGGERATGPLSPYPVAWTAITRIARPDTRRRILAPVRRRSTGFFLNGIEIGTPPYGRLGDGWRSVETPAICLQGRAL